MGAGVFILMTLMTGMVVADTLQLRDRGPTSEVQVEAFRRRLLGALVQRDRRAVAGMVRYRLIVDAGGLLIPVGDRETLVRLWDIVFSPAMRCLIEESSFRRLGSAPPKYSMYVDSAGATLGDGRIRIDRGADGLKITRLTLPPGYGAGTAAKPRRVSFRWGSGRAVYAGALSADNRDVYLVWARKGAVLNAQLERVRAESASVQVVQQSREVVLRTAGPSGANPWRLWAGSIPETGEYRVEVVRRAAFCDPPITYQLTISVD